jgi:phosphoribosyl 1,2-cyclic phosphodiesterase
MASVFTVKFRGVRGLVPSPGDSYTDVGGDTSCVEVRCGNELMVFDCGTGIRSLGDRLEHQSAPTVRIFLTHFHWDHVQGLPFFAPLRRRNAVVDFFGPSGGVEVLDRVLGGHAGTHQGLESLEAMEARTGYRELKEGQAVSCGDAVVTSARLNHPGGVMAYRVDFGGHSVVLATDTEHFSCPDQKLVRLADQADLLIYDCTFTPDEYAGASGGVPKTGLGHSTFEHGIQVARSGGVRHLALFHHHPDRTDPEVASMEEQARRLFSQSTAARQDMAVELL